MSAEEIEKLNLPIDVVSNVLRGGDVGLKEMVLKYVLLMSGKDDCSQLTKDDVIINDLLEVAAKNNNSTGQLALDSIINITSSELGCNKVVESLNHLKKILKFSLERNSMLADRACKILSNVTRQENLAVKVGRMIISDHGLSVLIGAISDKSYNSSGQRLEFLAQAFGNLTQCVEFQNFLVDPVNGQLQRVLPVLHSGVTLVERSGIASALYNCLFDTKSHMTLLEAPFDILPVLLLPLAGPEEFDEEEYDKMPLELQYLPEDKRREADPHVRNLLLRSLLLLCSTKPCRIFVRDRNTYLILREYHKWEKDRVNLLAVENVIDILIRTEEEIGVNDLKSVEVPDDLKNKFEKWDRDFITGD
ncbi:protein HGH1 homolog isoform X2 [Cimex lectularius]|nr:protein HGH1 homolog isoform X2 [Cimex lectularius]XP_024080339.1 protein HGH1 homolog isoform X2 [Cimex lectularius]XP_024080340.1 protein HGH1 homolog isoform X2 [Cimex lectularius]